jgi:phage major head subunit gpT-like protein
MMTLGNWKNTVLPGLTGTFCNEYLIEQSMIPDLYSVETSDRYQEKIQNYASVGKFQKFLGQIAKVQGSEAYAKTIIHSEWAAGTEIEYRLAKDDMYNVIKPKVMDLAYSARRTKEIDAFDIFNYAFSTTLSTGGDSVALCSSAHPSPISGVANQSNTGTSALSYTSYVTTRNYMRKFYDFNGIVLSVTPDTLMVPVDLGETAIAITESQLKDSNFQVSVINKSWKPKVLISQYLTDTNNWFLMASREMKMHLKWYNREPLKLFDDSSTNNLVMTFAGYYRCSRDFTDWKWCFGHNVAG